MTLEQRARASADTVRADLAAIPLPETASVVRRARRRRRNGVVATALVAAAALAVTVAVFNRDDTKQRIEVTGPPPTVLPVGAVVHGDWTMIPKPASGIGSNTTLSALASAFHFRRMSTACWSGGTRGCACDSSSGSSVVA